MQEGGRRVRTGGDVPRGAEVTGTRGQEGYRQYLKLDKAENGFSPGAFKCSAALLTPGL